MSFSFSQNILLLFFGLIIGVPTEVLSAAPLQNTFGTEAELGLYYGIGSMGDYKGSSPTRSMSSIDVFGTFGFRMASLVTFAQLEYRFLSQSTSPDSVREQNLSGESYLIGVGIKYLMKQLSVGLGTYVYGTHRLSKQTTEGLPVHYSQPSGLFAVIAYSLSQWVRVQVKYSEASYAQKTIDSQDYDISSNRMDHKTYSIGLVYQF